MKLANVSGFGRVAILSFAVAACGGTVSDFSDGGTTGDHGSAANPSGGSTSLTAKPPSSFTPAQVKAALARCNDPHGPLVDIQTWGDVRSNLTSAWAVCSAVDANADGGTTPTVFSTGIELYADGTFQSLITDGNGGLVAGNGSVNAGNYFFYDGNDRDVFSDSDTVLNGPPYFTIAANSGDQTPAGQFVGSVTFESSPRRMYATQVYDNTQAEQIDVWLISLDQ